MQKWPCTIIVLVLLFLVVAKAQKCSKTEESAFFRRVAVNSEERPLGSSETRARCAEQCMDSGNQCLAYTIQANSNGSVVCQLNVLWSGNGQGWIKDLAGFWPMNSLDGLRDLAEGQHHAVMTGTVPMTSGLKGENAGSYSFTGNAGNYLRIWRKEAADSLDVGDRITIATYMTAVESEGPVFDYQGTLDQWAVHMWVTGPSLYFDVSGITQHTSYVPPEGFWKNWQWVAGTFSKRSMTLRIYVNNTEVSSLQLPENVDWRYVSTAGQYISIGEKTPDSRRLRARLTCVMLFNKDLVVEELKQAQELCHVTRQ